MSERCGSCGRDPAAGLAAIGDVRYCHGDWDRSPTCYMRATEAQAGVSDNVIPFQRRPLDAEDAPRWSDGQVQRRCSEFVHVFASVPGRCQCGERQWNPDEGTTDAAPTFRPSA